MYLKVRIRSIPKNPTWRKCDGTEIQYSHLIARNSTCMANSVLIFEWIMPTKNEILCGSGTCKWISAKLLIMERKVVTVTVN